MHETVKEIVGKDVFVEITFADQINKEKSGKLRAVVSKVKRLEL